MGDKNRTGQPSSVLICGNVSVFDFMTVKLISEYYNITVAGEETVHDIDTSKFGRRIHIYTEATDSENFEKIVYSFSPDAVWYISGFVDNGKGIDNEIKKIEKLMHICQVNEVPKIIVVTSIDGLNYTLSGQGDALVKKYPSAKGFNCNLLEQLISYSAEKYNLKILTVRVPYISQKINRGNYLDELFKSTVDGTKISFPYNEKQQIEFMSARDLAELLVAMTEETIDSTSSYTALNGFKQTYGEVAEKLQYFNPKLKVGFDDRAYYDLVLNENVESERIRKTYGFIATDNVFADLDEMYEDYKKSVIQKKDIFDKVKKYLKKFSSTILKTAELFIIFAIIQILLKYTTDNVLFKYVDLRLFFVVIMGTAHGMIIGLAAGLLECISLIFAYAQIGVTGTMLFYNMDYWLPFAIYLMTGAIVGYLVSAKDQKLRFAEEEIITMQDRYLFLNDVYMSVIDNKEEYKRQILGYQDSFGKIFEAVEKLNSSTPADIFMNGVDTLEHILENNSIAIYTMDDYQKYARLVACSREMTDKLRRSISVAEFQDAYDVIVTGETYKNTEFKDNLPVYAYAIVEKEKVRLMVCIYEALPEQMGLYYMNLFTILGNLIRVSFLRALEYQEAIEDEKYFKGTEILIPEFFERELESQRKMSEAGIASYMLLKLNAEDEKKASAQLQGLIRHSDTVGKGEDGNFYLLLTQITRDIFGIIGERLEGKGVSYEIVEGM